MEDSILNQSSQTEEKSENSMSPKLIAGALVIIIVVAIAGFSSKNKSRPSSGQKQVIVTPNSSKTMGVAATGLSSSSSYKDNTYSAEGDYVSPGGDEHLLVKVTLKGGVITGAEVNPEATRPNSVKFQGLFVANFKPFVVGKNIDEVKLDKVSGSSLTPKGFNDALEKIKQQAKA